MNDTYPVESWSDIGLFLAIVEHGSLSSAAEHVNLTQPTLGRRLSSLEKRLGVTLLVRGGRRMQLTDAGNAIVENARRMNREMFAIGRAVDVHSIGLSGEVTISATEGTGTEWLAPELIDFHLQYPDIFINIQIENRTVDLIHREADIALRLGRPTQPDLIARHLIDISFAMYASKEYLDRNGTPKSIEDLARHNLIGFEKHDGSVGVAFGDSEFLSNQSSRTVFRTNSAAAQLSAARAGFGIAVLSCRWASMYPDLIRVEPNVEVFSAELWLVTHEELRHSARIRAVSDFLIERVRESHALFQPHSAAK